MPAVDERLARRVRRAVIALGVLTIVAMIWTWPGRAPASGVAAPDTAGGTVREVTEVPCTGTLPDDDVACRRLLVEIREGGDRGRVVEIEQAVTELSTRTPQTGDEVVLTVTPGDGGAVYSISDYERSSSMLVLTAIFAIAVVALGRWRGVGALAGLAASIVVVLLYVLPGLLRGSDPVVIALVGSSLIAVVSLHLAHGPGTSTHIALLATLASLLLTGVLARIFIAVTTLTGAADENASLLQSFGLAIDPRGLLLAGVVLGSLGVLDDVTVTQVSAVGELRVARPDLSRRDLYRSALAIGRDHVSSTVNTLFLAYVGASLPLLLLFTSSRQSLGAAVTGEVIAVEVVRTLVGSIGLVASVPIATALAAVVLVPQRRSDSS